MRDIRERERDTSARCFFYEPTSSPLSAPSYPLLRLRRRLDVVQSHRHHRPVHEILHVENEARLGNATRVKDRKGRRGAEGKINWRFSTVDPQWENGWGERVTAVPSGERNQIFIDSLEGKMYRGEMTDRSSVTENGARRCFSAYS